MKKLGKNLLQFVPNFTVIDLETTGRSNKYEDITELSGVRYRNNEPVAKFSTLVKAKNSIIPFVEGLTGITNAMISDAPEIESVIADFVEFIGNDIILGHNVEFDYGLVSEAYEGIMGFSMQNDYIDTLRISRLLNKDIENHKLGTLCSYFNVPRDVAHRGLSDSLQTAQVYLAMRSKYKQLTVIKKEN